MKPQAGEYLSIYAVAKRLGMTKSTLWKQVKSGAIRSHGGKLILAEVIEDRASNIDHRKARGRGRPAPEAEPVVERRGRGRPKGARNKPKAETARPAAETKPETTPEAAPTAPKAGKDGTDYASFSAAQARRENAMADMRQLEYAQKAGRLIDRAEHDRILFERAREYRDALLAWPVRVQELIAAQLVPDPETGRIAADDIGAVLNDFVRDFLAEQSGDDGERRAA